MGLPCLVQAILKPQIVFNSSSYRDSWSCHSLNPAPVRQKPSSTCLLSLEAGMYVHGIMIDCFSRDALSAFWKFTPGNERNESALLFQETTSHYKAISGRTVPWCDATAECLDNRLMQMMIVDDLWRRFKTDITVTSNTWLYVNVLVCLCACVGMHRDVYKPTAVKCSKFNFLHRTRGNKSVSSRQL